MNNFKIANSCSKRAFLKISGNLLFFQFGQFQKLPTWENRKIYNLEDEKNFKFEIFNLENSKNFEFGIFNLKIQNFPILKISD